MEQTTNTSGKVKTIIYWIVTIFMCFGMGSGGVAQLLKVKETVEGVTHLGYPSYILTLFGIWKILGVIAVLVPKFPLVKEWAYAGFFFLMTGALFSHVSSGDSLGESFGSIMLTVLIVLSWYLRPADRKIASVNQ